MVRLMAVSIIQARNCNEWAPTSVLGMKLDGS